MKCGDLKKHEIVTGNYAIFYLDGVKTEKGVIVEFRIRTFKYVTKVKCIILLIFVNVSASQLIF